MSNHSRNLYSYKFLFPGMLLFSMFFIIPTILSFYFAFTNWSLDGFRFIGIDNFKNIIAEPTLSLAFKNTIIFTVITTILKLGLGLILALLLNMGLKSQGYLRTIFFTPAILSSVAVGLTFSSIFHPTSGIINRLLNIVGLHILTRDWLGDIHLVIYSVSMIEVWKWTGFTAVIFLAGLQSISKEYYEALSIDGANKWQTFRYITFPLLRPAFNTNLLLAVIGGLRVFDIVYATTGGGPGTASEVISSFVYRKFANGYFGLSTAVGLLLFVLVSGVAVPLYAWTSKKEVEM